MPKLKPQQDRPRDLRVVVVHGVEYMVDWEKMIPGASFFLPTVATVAQVKAAISIPVRVYGYRVELRTRREYGRYGVRVWRLY